MNLDKVTQTVESLQKSVDNVKNVVDSDKDNNYHHKQEQLKSKIKESNVTLTGTKNVGFFFDVSKNFDIFFLKMLKELDDKLAEITKKLPKSESNNMDVNTLLIHLSNLKKNINQKEKEVDQRNNKIKGIQIENSAS
jgi:hypothetical protein